MQNTLYDQEELRIRFEDLVENGATRVPICLCLDTSYSMQLSRNIDRLNEGLAQFLEYIKQDEIAAQAAEICIITFGGSRAQVLYDFDAASKIGKPVLCADGDTPLGEAVLLALEKLRIRKLEYQGAGVDYYQPWLVIMSDGVATDPQHLAQAAEQTQALIQANKLYTVPVSVADQSELAKGLSNQSRSNLALFSKNNKVYRMEELAFREFFLWLSKSVSKVSQSSAGESIDFDMDIPLSTWEDFY